MMKKDWRIAVLLTVVLLVFLAACVQVVHEGLRHWRAQNYFALASEHFQTGEYSQAMKFGLAGIGATLEGGIRWTMGRPHLLRAQTMLYEGRDLYGALDECELAYAFIGMTFDDEGGISYLCWRIRAEINPDVWMDPTAPIPTRTLTPP